MLHGDNAAFHGVVAFDHVRGRDGEAELSHGFEECIAAGHDGTQAQRAGDEGDLAVAEGGEVLDGLTDSLCVIDFEDADVGQVGAGVDED